MTWRIWLSSIAATALVACGGGGGGGGSGGGALTITATPSVLVANGVNASIIHVDGSQKGPIVVRTDRGHFLESGGLTASNNSTPFDVTLVTCDSQVVAGCAGNALVNASDQNLASGRVQVRFVQAEICNNGISDDGSGLIDCANPACPPGPTTYCGSLTTVVKKVCTAGTPNFCGCPSANPADCVDCSVAGNAGQKCNTKTTGTSGSTIYGSCKTGGVCSCVSTQGTKETSCGDGIDNDCDGLIDCDDPDCQPVGNLLGGICDTLGHTCSLKALTNGTSICGVTCSGNGGTPQLVETTCMGGKDEDCNGLADCQDPNCASQGLPCSTTGKVCGGTSGPNAYQCICNSPEYLTGEQTCDDKIDNDCNGYTDCKDVNCNLKRCGPNGMICNTTANGSGTCVCPGGTTEICNDGIDNNCDGHVDCDDPTCRPTTIGGVGKGCAAGFPVGGGAKCDYYGQCVCPGGQSNETTCNDGVDNDCNGFIDCADASCSGQPCTLAGKVGTICKTIASNGAAGFGCSCAATPGSDGTVEVCDDSIDNNCDGKIDCADSACQAGGGQPCNPAFPTYKCTNVGTVPAPSWVCKDSSAYVITVNASPLRIPADGMATAAVNALVKDTTSGPGTPVAGKTVTFTSSLGSITASAATDATGTALATFASTDASVSGGALITATFAYPQPGPPSGSVSAVTTVTMPQLSSITGSAHWQIMGARDSGYQEANEITFQLTDSTNAPYPAGLTVNFTHAPQSGSYIGSTPVCTATLCTATGVTKADGTVKVVLHSGRTDSVVAVSATAQAGGSGPRTVTVSNIVVVAAKASGANISLDCTHKNVPALTSQDCLNSFYADSKDNVIGCTVTLLDRNGKALGVSTVANFYSEAGGIASPAATTPAYDLSKAPGAQIGLGIATNRISVYGNKLPLDVAPFLNEHSVVHSWDNCLPARTHNPRDGLVTVLVVVPGEEGFMDGSNGCPSDGAYTPPGSRRVPAVSCGGLSGGDLTCCQLGENFIDLGEPFVDSNDNGVHDPGEFFVDLNGNNQWDGPNGVRDSDTQIWAQTRVLYTGFEVVAQVGGLEEASRFFITPLPPGGTAPVSFAVSAQQAGPPLVPATSETVPLFFTDPNFNLPNYRYTYGTPKVSTGANITDAFALNGTPNSFDGLGMSVTQQYCQPDLTQCDFVCDPSKWDTCINIPSLPAPFCKVDVATCSNTCGSSPCYSVLLVSNYAYGTYGAVTVTGGTKPDSGQVCALATGTITLSDSSNASTAYATTAVVCGTSQ